MHGLIPCSLGSFLVSITLSVFHRNVQSSSVRFRCPCWNFHNHRSTAHSQTPSQLYTNNHWSNTRRCSITIRDSRTPKQRGSMEHLSPGSCCFPSNGLIRPAVLVPDRWHTRCSIRSMGRSRGVSQLQSEYWLLHSLVDTLSYLASSIPRSL